MEKFGFWPARFFRPAFFLLFLAAACDTELPIETEQSQLSETRLSLSVDAVNFEPTFIGRTSRRTVVVDYGDTLDIDIILLTSDSTVFSVSPDSIHFSKKNRTAAVDLTYKPSSPDSIDLGYLILIAFQWLDTLKLTPDTVGVDSVRLAGAGQGFFLDMEMVFIPGGTFVMGSDSASVGADHSRFDELPAHQVQLSDFFIGRYEVTNLQYYEFWKQDSTGHTPKDTLIMGSWPQIALDKPNFPVTGVSWEDAMAFCRWLSLRTGALYTLPTEAQWEYAATGGAAREYPWSAVEDQETTQDTITGGQLEPSQLANTRRSGDGYTFTAPVDAFSAGASAFGVFNMAGNVWEWCLDWYDPDYYKKPDELWIDPQGPQDLEHRIFKVIRGGSCLEELNEARTRNRSALAPGNREINVGFRVVRLP
ncbi:MAG: hypothetical protein DRG82_15955 [Deltaproteobacteria bacterium]|nr:MAG: hypothetical protein DRG82_15955 [Deltaproteobacteria bacterium]